MHDIFSIFLNGGTVLLWLTIIVMIVTRILEFKGLEYTIKKRTDGLTFKYKIGVYRGKVSLILDEQITTPQVLPGVHGWECRFPTYFTRKEMCSYVGSFMMSYYKNKGSHSKDLIIFDEIVNRKNDAIVSINGKLFAYDNKDHKPF